MLNPYERRYHPRNPPLYRLAQILIDCSSGPDSGCEQTAVGLLTDLRMQRPYDPARHGHDGPHGAVARACAELHAALACVNMRLVNLDAERQASIAQAVSRSRAA